MLCIWGSGNYGKSETIRELYTVMTGIVMPGDFCKSFMYKDLKFTVQTAGDNLHELQTLSKEVKKESPDFIICATRSKGKTIHEAVKIGKNGNYEMLWMSTVYVPTHNFLYHDMNKDYAKYIKNLIDGIIAGKY